MAIDVLPGDPIPLIVQLEDGAESLPVFVRAFVTDASGVPLAGSPVNLPSLGDGLFRSNALSMPPETIQARFVVYEDSAYTIESRDFFHSLEVYQPAGLGGGGGSAGGFLGRVTGEILPASVEGVFEKETPLIGNVGSEILTGTVLESSQTTGNILESSLEGELE